MERVGLVRILITAEAGVSREVPIDSEFASDIAHPVAAFIAIDVAAADVGPILQVNSLST